MRRWMCVPMILLCLLTTACGGAEKKTAANLRDRYHDMEGCTMEATVSCDQDGTLWEAQMRCNYVPGGKSTLEVLSPETIAGVKATLSDTDWTLEYDGLCLSAGPLGKEEISPALCLPRLMNALRDGWLLEENEEQWGEVPCVRIAVDQSGTQDGKIVSTLWLRKEDGLPVRGEIAVEGEIILTAEFTSFEFCDTMQES